MADTILQPQAGPRRPTFGQLRDLIRSATDRIANCTGTVGLALDAIEAADDDGKQRHAFSALSLAYKELRLIEIELDREWVQSAYVPDAEVDNG